MTNWPPRHPEDDWAADFAAEEPAPGGAWPPRPTEALSWAFRAGLNNAGVWLTAGLALGAAAGFMQAFVGPNIEPGQIDEAALASLARGAVTYSLLASVLALLVAPLAVTAALRQVDRPRLDWGSALRGANYGPTFLTQLLAGLAQLAALVVVSMLAAPIIGGALAAGPGGAAIASLLSVLVGVAAPILLAPFLIYWQFFAADRRATFGRAIALGAALGRAAYKPTVGLVALVVGYGIVVSLVVGLVSAAVAPAGPTAVAVVSSALSAAATLPVAALSAAHLFRQAVGGPLPPAGEAPRAL